MRKFDPLFLFGIKGRVGRFVRVGVIVAFVALPLFMANLCSVKADGSNTYYVRNDGSDTRCTGLVDAPDPGSGGAGQACAWKTIAKVNSATFSPGDSILLRKGDKWNEKLTVSSSGVAGNPITYGAYGSGALPILDGSLPVTGWAQDIVNSVNASSQPATGTDDGYWANTSAFNSTAAWNYLGVFSASPTKSFIRFPNISVPKGATINSATINLKASDADSVSGITLSIKAVAEDNPAAPISAADGNGRAVTSASVSWSTPNNWVINSVKTTPDLTAIIQEITTRSNWASGNSMLFYFIGTGTTYVYHSGYQMEGEAPTITISYTPAASPVYYSSLAYNPNVVFEDGTPLTFAGSKVAMTAGSFFYETGTSKLYIWTREGSDPSTHTIEAAYNPTPFHGLVNIGTKNYITIDSLDITKTSYYGVYFEGSSNIIIQNCSFEYSYRDDIESSESAGKNPDHIYVLNNTFRNNGIYRSRTGGAEGLAVNIIGWQTAIVHGNVVDGQYGESIQAFAGAQDVEISNNIITNSRYAGIYISAGYVNGGTTRNIIVKQNKVTASAVHQYQIATETSDGIDGVQFYDNIADGTGSVQGGAALLFGYLGAGVIKNVSVYNNTFYNTVTGIMAYGPTTDASNSFKNNIIYATTRAWDQQDTNEDNYSPDYNLLLGATAVRWKGTTYNVLSGFQAAKSKMLHSIDTNPNLVNPSVGNYSLRSDSPAINAGTDVGLTFDFNGLTVPQGEVPDIGAFEYPANPLNYYVDIVNGNDNNNGLTPEQAWKTIAKVNSRNFLPGDAILFKRGGTWREQLTVPSSGISGNPITFGTYGEGDAPKISGADLYNTGWTNTSGQVWQHAATTQPHLVFINGSLGDLKSSIATVQSGGALSWWWSSNILYVYSASNPAIAYSNPGVEVSVRADVVREAQSYITFDSLHLTQANDDGFENYTAGVISIGIIIQNSTIDYNAGSGIYSGYDQTGYGTGWLIRNNNISHNGYQGSGIQRHAIYFNYGNNWTIQNNTMEYNLHYGISIGHNSDSNTFKYNVIDNNGYGGFAMYDGGAGGCDNNQFSYNVVYNNHSYGAAIFDSTNTANLFYNNVFYGYTDAGFYVDADPANLGTLKNNIFWSPNSPAHGALFNYGTSHNAGMVSDYNLYGPEQSNYLVWHGNYYSTLAAYVAATNLDSHSLKSDPLFSNMDGGDFRLTANSPAINGGITLNILADFSGIVIPQGGISDIGAYEYTLPATVSYYVDATGGSDTNNGLSVGQAWKTLSKVNSHAFAPGDQILFKRGETWREQLTVPSSGTSENPITFGAYGEGDNPVFNGSDVLSSGWSAVPSSLTTNVVSYWKLNETSGMRVDSVGANSLTPAGSPLPGSTTGIQGNAVSLNSASSQSLSRASNTSLQVGGNVPFAITAWVKPTDVSFSSIVTKLDGSWDHNHTEYEIYIYDGKVRFQIANGTTKTEVVDQDTIATGDIFFVVSWYDPTSQTINIQKNNGTVYTAAWTGGTYTGTGNFTIGVEGELNQYYFNGWIDEVAFRKGSFWNASERGSLYHSGQGVTLPFSSIAQSYTLTTQPTQVFFDSIKGRLASSLSDITSPRDWFWNSNTLYVYGTSDPSFTYTSPGIEASVRAAGFTARGKSSLVIDGVDTTKATDGIQIYDWDEVGAKDFTAQNLSSTYNAHNGIYLAIPNVTVKNVHSTWNGSTNQHHGIYLARTSLNDFSFADNYLISDSFFQHNYGAGIHIYNVGGGIVKNNNVGDNGTTANGGWGIITSGMAAGKTLNIINNVIYGNKYHALTVSDLASGTRVNVYNNSLFGNSLDYYGEGILLGNNNVTSRVEVKNNILDNLYTEIVQSNMVGIYDVDYNLYFHPSGAAFTWGGTDYSQAQFLNYKSASGQDTHSIIGIPEFIDSTSNNFTLQSTSPAINAGVDVSLTSDILGTTVPQGGVPDIGAYEYLETVSPITSDSGTDLDWHSTDVTVAFACADAHGCQATHYTTDGSDPTLSSPMGSTVVLSTSGIYTIKYFSVDNFNNSEVIRTASHQVKVDKTGPTSGSVVINSGASKTDKQSITLALSAVDPLSGISQMIVSQRNDFSDASWETYTTSKSFILSATQGKRVIYVKFKDNMGNESAIYSNTILLDTSLPITTTTSSLSSSSTSSTISTLLPAEGSISKYEINIKVIDTDGNPVEGAEVTIYSDPQVAYTDASGIATFVGVVGGDHRVVISYNGTQTDQQITIDGQEPQLNLSFQMTPPANNNILIAVGGTVGLLAVIYLGFKFFRRDRLF